MYDMYLRSGRDLRFRMEKKRPSVSASLICSARCRRFIDKMTGTPGYLTVVEEIQGLVGTGKSLMESACDAAALFAVRLEMHLVNGWAPPGKRPGKRHISHRLCDLFEPFADIFEWDVGVPPEDFLIEGFFNENKKVVAVCWIEQIEDKQQYYVWHRSGPPMKSLEVESKQQGLLQQAKKIKKENQKLPRKDNICQSAAQT